MKKIDYIQMLVEENTADNQKLYSDVIDCLDIALSQEPDDFEIADTSLSAKELYAMIEKRARETKAKSIGPFEVAEMFAQHFGAKYVRLSKRTSTPSAKIINLADFL